MIFHHHAVIVPIPPRFSMRSLLQASVALLLSVGCGAPQVSNSLVRQLPQRSMVIADTLQVEIDGLDGAVAQKERDVRDARDDAEVLDLEIRAQRATIQADRAAIKSTRKAGATDQVAAVTERLAMSEAVLDALRGQAGVQNERVSLLEAQLVVVQAQADVRRSERQLALGRAVDVEVQALDVARLGEARASAELDFQRALEDVANAERKYTEAGGDGIPPSLLMENSVAVSRQESEFATARVAATSPGLVAAPAVLTAGMSSAEREAAAVVRATERAERETAQAEQTVERVEERGERETTRTERETTQAQQTAERAIELMERESTQAHQAAVHEAEPAQQASEQAQARADGEAEHAVQTMARVEEQARERAVQAAASQAEERLQAAAATALAEEQDRETPRKW
jgi:hypothetical protein